MNAVVYVFDTGHTMKIRKAVEADMDSVEKIYEKIHTSEEKGEATTG